MRIVAVPKHLDTLFTLFKYGYRFGLVEVIKNGCVVMRRNVERSFGKVPAVFQKRIAFVFREHIGQPAVIVFRSDDNHIIEVFGGCAYQRYPTDIDLFDDLLFRSARSYGFLKRIKVYNNEVNLRYFIFVQLLLIRFKRPARQDAAEHLRVQGFYAAAQNRWITGKIFYGNDIVP